MVIALPLDGVTVASAGPAATQIEMDPVSPDPGTDGRHGQGVPQCGAQQPAVGELLTIATQRGHERWLAFPDGG
jgi:hypothetical protein